MMIAPLPVTQPRFTLDVAEIVGGGSRTVLMLFTLGFIVGSANGLLEAAVFGVLRHVLLAAGVPSSSSE